MAVTLYIIRHGIAVDRGEGINEADRPLTPKGRQKTQAVAQRLKILGIEFSEILTSPLARARQTAEILLREGLSAQVNVTDTLAPGGSFSDWLDWLKVYNRSGEETAIALVGHEPDLSQWAERLLWGEVRGVLLLKKAGIIGLTIPEDIDPVGNTVLFWLTPPKFLLIS
jgi:phosphohistidine phosphatase